MAGAELQRLAYELSLRALERQEHVVDELRARTGALVAAASLAASFLGASAASDGTNVVTVVALVIFVAAITASVYVLLPKEDLVFSLRGSVLFETESDDPGGLSETYRRLAYWLEEYHDGNQPTIDRLFSVYRGATGGVVIAVVLWVLNLALD